MFNVSCTFRNIDYTIFRLQPIRFGAKRSYLSTKRFQLAGYITAYCTFLPISTSSAWFNKSSSWINVNSFFICNSKFINRAQTSAQNGSISQNISHVGYKRKNPDCRFGYRDEEENMCLGFISITYDRHRFQGHAFAEWQSDSA